MMYDDSDTAPHRAHAVRFKALTFCDLPEVIAFMLQCDDETLWHRFRSTQTVRLIFNHFGQLREDETCLFAAYHRKIIALAELYRVDETWSRAELALTVPLNAASDQIFGELSQLPLLTLATLGTAELHLDSRDYERVLHRYFNVFPIIHHDQERVHLNLLDHQ